MNERELKNRIDRVPAGRWAVGVSGGADSVALLLLLRQRTDLSLVVAHLDHETRAGQSTEDAAFVQDLCDQLKIECLRARRSEVEAGKTDLPSNLSARYRAIRLDFFRRIVNERALSGILLAHHADDQAETILQRLLRGSSVSGLTGMKIQTVVHGMTILRPFLSAHRNDLRDWLVAQHQTWRDDPTNESDLYLRGRLRRLLRDHPNLFSELLNLADTCTALTTWVQSAAPYLNERFHCVELASLPELLAKESARRWLLERGARPDHLSPSVLLRLIAMASDLATPSRVQFPGNITAGRKEGMIGT